MQQGIQDKQEGNLKKYGCAYLCLLQLLKPDLEGVPDIEIPNSLMSSDAYYIKDWVKLYNFLNTELKCGKDLVDGVIPNRYEKGEVQICKNVKADNKTIHFTLRKDDIDVFDPLPPDRKAVKEKHYIKHFPYYFYTRAVKDETYIKHLNYYFYPVHSKKDS
jgi:hypothetical protein